MVRWTSLGIAVVLAQAALAAPGAAATITGTPFDDTLVGTPSNDRIHGRAGNDDITGGKGDDWLFGDADQDPFRWGSGDGHDRIAGGPDFNVLFIPAVRKLRLRFDALGAGPETRP